LKITPSYISDLVNFYSNTEQPSWEFDPSGKDMRNLQVQGAAKVYNLLDRYGIALLADEVGMGKTIQALTVCAALWNEKPNARVLILAPRDEIAQNWMKEYQTFIRYHYRSNDNIVKSISGNEPIKKMIFCQNFYQLVHEIQQGWGQLFIGKISSFSSLMSRKDIIGRLEKLNITGTKKIKDLQGERDRELNDEVITLLKKEIVRHSDDEKPFFDLVIIDEAHYLRNKQGNSLKVGSATEFFGNPNDSESVSIAKKVLLLTATPNHSSSRDIESIVSYFTNRFQNQPYHSILETICVRRLRRLSENGYNKYNYRKEIPAQSSFDKNPLGEIFFGLYQHELAKAVNQKKIDGINGKGASQMMKYLEGVEFIPFEKSTEKNEEVEQEINHVSSDYTNGADAELLLTISKKYKDIFGFEPGHPKYNKLIEDLTTKHNNEKAVVFVRRIPSVFEISKRVIDFYDQQMWSIFDGTDLGKISFDKVDRKVFRKITYSLKNDQEVDDEVISNSNEKEKNIPSSRVLNLFKVVKNDTIRTTDASNFRLRFTHSKSSVFSLFFSPGEDYFSKPYVSFQSYRFDTAGDRLENFYSSALLQRANRLEKGISKDLLSSLLPKLPIENDYEEKNEVLPTLITVFWEQYLSDENIEPVIRANVKNAYEGFTLYEKEAFSNFLEKGVLLASEALVWLYRIFISIDATAEDKPIAVYLKFIDHVQRELKDQRLYNQIAESILHFRQIYTKVFSINGNKMLIEETWDSFNNAQPIYPYNADNSSKKILRCFNTPFYPDFLVATSVLQEGVNLQYFCDTIYHYGMAWTPGDNEQRIGRVDRMFGKIERRLKEDSSSNLHIYYPYLKDTVDEDQLARFVKRKYKEEQLIDIGSGFEEKTDYDLADNDNDAWKEFLRVPAKNEILDPFPVDLEEFNGIGVKAKQVKSFSLEDFFQTIATSISEITQFRPQIYSINQQHEQKILVDPILPGGRNQPVVIDLIYDHIGSGFSGYSVYCLQMKTPLAPFNKYTILRDQFEDPALQSVYLPGVKLCLDQSQTSCNSWGIYMSIELPLFIKDIDINPLSSEEIQEAFTTLVICADKTEAKLFVRDISKDELNLSTNQLSKSGNRGFRKAKIQNSIHSWSTKGNYHILESIAEKSTVGANYGRTALILNHENLFIKTFSENNQWKHQVAYLNKDAFKDELDLLEKHYSIFLANQKWK
jgi:hypothetical protein